MKSLTWIPGRAFAGHIVASGLRHTRARVTARALRRLDDHLLADIGIARDEIKAISRSAGNI